MWIKQENVSCNSFAFSILKVGWILSSIDEEWGSLDLFNQGYLGYSLYIFFAEISVFSTESYLCVNIGNIGKEGRFWKSDS